MGAVEQTPEPYRIRCTAISARRLQDLQGPARERVRRRLLDLADMAAFAARYALPIARIELLVAGVEGLYLEYEVDDERRILTVLAIETT